MSEYYRCRVVHQRSLDHFPRVDRGLGQRAAKEFFRDDQPVPGVHPQAHEYFMLVTADPATQECRRRTGRGQIDARTAHVFLHCPDVKLLRSGDLRLRLVGRPLFPCDEACLSCRPDPENFREGTC